MQHPTHEHTQFDRLCEPLDEWDTLPLLALSFTHSPVVLGALEACALLRRQHFLWILQLS